MATDSKRNSLGRGLSALLDTPPAETAPTQAKGSAESLPIELIRPNPQQPRRAVSEAELDELTRSVADKGVLQPIIVRPHPQEAGIYEIVAGERRWRAAQRVPLHEIPVLIRALDDREVLELAIIENLQRQDLTPIEEAAAYQRLAEEFGHTQEIIAEQVSKSRSHVANLMRLLSLPIGVQDMVQRGELSAGHARALIGQDDPEALAREVVRKGLTVRQTEKVAQRKTPPSAATESKKSSEGGKDPNTSALERDLSNVLGLGVEIRFRGSGGSLVLHYRSVDQLDDILHRLSRGAHGMAAGSPGNGEEESGDWPNDGGESTSIAESDEALSWAGGEDASEDLDPPDITGVINDLIKR